MEFLWQKESTNDNPLYRDLFANIENDYPDYLSYNLTSMSADVFERQMAKKNAFSDQRRKDGNEEFAKGKWETAIKCYNESLCLAETGTENIALAYGNRSACYIELKMYGKCIVDIELALNETSCPERLKPKLEKRKAECLKSLSADALPEVFEVKLSYEAHKNFPFMANVLEIQKNAEFGRHVIAKCNIPVGKTVVFEDNFVSYTKANNYITKNEDPMKCITCNKIAPNPVPCPKCTVVMFCSPKCRNGNKVHQMDCGAVYYIDDSINNKNIIQSVLVAVILFPIVDELMKFVEDAVTAEKLEIPTSVVDPPSKYRMFLKLWMPPTMKEFIPISYKLFKTIMRLDVIQKLFDSEEKQRFLMHLVGHHAVILLLNSLQGQMSLFASLFSHSCVPNIQEIWVDNRTACITIRPIKKGEQLYCSYMTEEVMKVHQKDHKVELLSRFGFRCKCLKCEEKLANVRTIEKDPLYQQISNTDLNTRNKVLLKDFINNCVKLLNKYSRMPWSTQSDYISKRLGFCLGLFYFSIVEVK